MFAATILFAHLAFPQDAPAARARAYNGKETYEYAVTGELKIDGGGDAIPIEGTAKIAVTFDQELIGTRLIKFTQSVDLKIGGEPEAYRGFEWHRMRADGGMSLYASQSEGGERAVDEGEKEVLPAEYRAGLEWVARDFDEETGAWRTGTAKCVGAEQVETKFGPRWCWRVESAFGSVEKTTEFFDPSLGQLVAMDVVSSFPGGTAQIRYDLVKYDLSE